MKKVIALTNRYIIIATPLILFLFFLSIYFFVMLQSSKPLFLLFGMFLTFLMIVTFSAGWGNMIKSAVEEKSYDEPYLIIKDFAPGVGEYFVPVLGLTLIISCINFLVFIFTYYAGMHFIGDIGVTADALSKAMVSQESLKTFLNSLSVDQLLRLNMWNFLVLSVMSLLCFLLMFYPPALFFETKNPFKALWISIKHTFGKNILINIGLFFMIFGINFIISALHAAFAGNTIIGFIMTLVNFYFICCAVTGVFYYYNKKFINSHLGNSIDTYI